MGVQHLEGICAKVEKLISMYESEKKRSADLSADLIACRQKLAACETKIKNLEQQNRILQQKLDNTQLADAIKSSSIDGQQARERLDAVMAELDKCVAMLNG